MPRSAETWKYGNAQLVARQLIHIPTFQPSSLAQHVLMFFNMFFNMYGADMGGKSSRLAAGGLPVRSHPGRVEGSLSKTPNPPNCS